MSHSFDNSCELLPFSVADITGGCDTRRSRPIGRRKREPAVADTACDLSEALEQAIVLGRNRAAARDIRLHAYIVDDLSIAAQAHDVLSTIDTMLAMATDMALWGSLIVCEAMMECDKAVVRLRFAGEPALCDPAGTPIIDCDLRREWPRLRARH